MFRIACAGLSLIALATDAGAQTPAVDYADIVEAGRPHVAPRAMSSDEQKQAGKAIGQWRSKKTEANLAAVRVFAEAGDVASLQAMMEGYLHLQKSPRDRGASAALPKPEQALTPLAGLWAMAHWRQAGGTLAAAKAMQPCMSNNAESVDGGYDYYRSIQSISSKGLDFDCGFDTRGSLFAIVEALNAVKNNRAPKAFPPLTFIERPLTSARDIQEARLKMVLERFVAANGMVDITPEDRKWVNELTRKDPEIARRWEDAQFDQRMTLISRSGDWIPENDSIWTYMRKDPARIKRYEAAREAAKSKAFNNAMQVTATLNKGRSEDRESSSWLAIRSSETANLWWRTYGGNISGNVPMLPQWCGSGVQAACAIQQQANTAADFRDKYGDPASLNSGRFTGASGSIDQGQFAKERADAKAACLAANLNGGAGCTD